MGYSGSSKNRRFYDNSPPHASALRCRDSGEDGERGRESQAVGRLNGCRFWIPSFGFGIMPRSVENRECRASSREPQNNAVFLSEGRRAIRTETELQMIYWKGKKFRVGKLIDHPEVMTQGNPLKELEENIVDAYKLPILDEVPEDHAAKEILVAV